MLCKVICIQQIYANGIRDKNDTIQCMELWPAMHSMLIFVIRVTEKFYLTTHLLTQFSHDLCWFSYTFVDFGNISHWMWNHLNSNATSMK